MPADPAEIYAAEQRFTEAMLALDAASRATRFASMDGVNFQAIQEQQALVEENFQQAKIALFALKKSLNSVE